MAKVIAPMGASEAHGALGKAIIFQVRSVKLWASPRNPRSSGQSANRDKFSDIGGIVATAGQRVRETLRTTFGAYWNSRLLKQAMLDTSGYYAEALAEWAGLSGPVQAEWEAAAPYKATKAFSPGQLFYMIVIGAYGDNENPFAQLGAVYMPLSAVVDWWRAGLDGVAMQGRIDSSSSLFLWTDAHSTISNGAAYGGSYEQSSEIYYPYCSILFYGRRLIWGYTKGPDFGQVQFESEYGYQFTFNQHAEEWSYQNTRNGVLRSLGIHLAKLIPQAPGVYNVDFVDVE